MLMEVAAVAGVIAVPLAIAMPFVSVVHGRERELRQRLREILFPLAKACHEYQLGDESRLTEQFIRGTVESLREVAKRDGLKAPNPETLGQLVNTVNDIWPRLTMEQDLAGLAPAERTQLLENNAQWLENRVAQAGAQAAVLTNATHAIDRYNYRVYRRLKWHGREDWTYVRLPRRLRPKKAGE